MTEFNSISIIGMGLMGGSMALSLKRAGFNGHIIGMDTSMESLEYAKNINALDIIAKDIKQGICSSDLIIIAVPLGYYEEIFKEISPYLKENVVVTDLGSVKGCVHHIAEKNLPKNASFIGGHPMAGSEKDGIQAANAFLYENAYYFLTPEDHIPLHIVDKLKKLVTSLGAYPVVISSDEHDKIVSQISHLPHLMASILVNTLDQNKGISSLPFVGGGFRDSTRIASGNPFMWKDIFFFNQKELLSSVKKLEEVLKECKRILENEDKENMLEHLKNAKLLRDSLPHHGKDYISPLYEIIVSVEDKPGVLGELTNLLGKNEINIKEIEILHSRQEEKGAIRLGLASLEEQKKALLILKSNQFPFAYRKGENP